MGEYARYEPEAPAEEQAEARVRLALESDAAAIAQLYATRHGRPFDEVEPGVLKEIEYQVAGTWPHRVFVAAVGEDTAAYGRVRRVVPGADGQPEMLPDGWYLMGVIVDPTLRRRGIALALGRHRLAWVAKRADEAYCFTNRKNHAALDLHRKLGFQPVELEFAHERAGLERGEGQLLRCVLDRDSAETR